MAQKCVAQKCAAQSALNRDKPKLPVKNLAQKPFWWALFGLILVSLILVGFGWWHSSGSNAPVQVPMFYDDHYVYPRPWTQAQEAPGVPEPTQVALLYGPNRLTQRFTSGADNLALLKIWLDGKDGAQVDISLSIEDGPTYGGSLELNEGKQEYLVAFPSIKHARDRLVTLTLMAPTATVLNPVITRSVGGDRLGNSLAINEYRRPGNIEIFAYSQGPPGLWWLDAIGEQLLPQAFRIRLQQYKPAQLKGPVFTILLAATIILTLLVLIISWPTDLPISTIFGWGLVGLILAFLLWQFASGKLLIPGLANPIELKEVAVPIPIAPDPGEDNRIAYDLTQSLWTAERLPEPRFIQTEKLESWPAIKVPANSRLNYQLQVPLDGSLTLGMAIEQGLSLRFTIQIGEDLLISESIGPDSYIVWKELDLSRWAGQAATLSLTTEAANENTTGYWLMPQVSTNGSWLLDEELAHEFTRLKRTYQFGDGIKLVGYHISNIITSETSQDNELIVDLFWRILEPTDDFATIFVHLIDDTDTIISQHDGQPVSGTYPTPYWQPGYIIADSHLLTVPQDFSGVQAKLAIGLYDPDSLERWVVTDGEGQTIADSRAVLELGDK